MICARVPINGSNDVTENDVDPSCARARFGVKVGIKSVMLSPRSTFLHNTLPSPPYTQLSDLSTMSGQEGKIFNVEEPKGAE